MWSLGCVLAELFLGRPLFPGETDYEQISYISLMMGNPPSILANNSTKMCRFFKKDDNGKWSLKVSLVEWCIKYCPLNSSIQYYCGQAVLDN